MENLFEVRVKYATIDNNGREKNVSENYILEAVNFSDAETRIHEELEKYVSSDINVLSIKRSNINDILKTEGQFIYKSTIEFITLDEEKGREKKSKFRVLVNAETVEEAYKNTNDWFRDTLSEYSIIGVIDSKLMDYYPF